MSETACSRIRYMSASKKRMLDASFHPTAWSSRHEPLLHRPLGRIDEVRTLKVARFHGVEMTADTFEKPPTFSLAAYTQGAFGVLARASSRRSKSASPIGPRPMSVSHQWHPSQKVVKDTANGSRRHVRAVQYDRVQTLAPRLRPARVVLSPKALASDIKSEFPRCLWVLRHQL